MWLAIFGLISGLLSEKAYAADSVRTICPASSFVSEPTMNSQGFLEAKLVSRCQITLVNSASIESLNRHLFETISTRNHVNRGPIAETFDDLPSSYFDITAHVKQENGDVNMRQDVHLATDSNTRLSYYTVATQIQGSGNAAYLRYLSYRQDISKAAEKTFRVTLSQSVQIEKPWYAPEKIFISQAKKSLAEGFERDVQKDIHSLGKMLQD